MGKTVPGDNMHILGINNTNDFCTESSTWDSFADLMCYELLPCRSCTGTVRALHGPRTDLHVPALGPSSLKC